MRLNASLRRAAAGCGGLRGLCDEGGVFDKATATKATRAERQPARAGKPERKQGAEVQQIRGRTARTTTAGKAVVAPNQNRTASPHRWTSPQLRTSHIARARLTSVDGGWGPAWLQRFANGKHTYVLRMRPWSKKDTFRHCRARTSWLDTNRGGGWWWSQLSKYRASTAESSKCYASSATTSVAAALSICRIVPPPPPPGEILSGGFALALCAE